jgi:hypothetical protein
MISTLFYKYKPLDVRQVTPYEKNFLIKAIHFLIITTTTKFHRFFKKEKKLPYTSKGDAMLWMDLIYKAQL